MDSGRHAGSNEGIEYHKLHEGGRADDRGWGIFPLSGHSPPIEPATCHIVQILPGKTRGNHYHPHAAEWLCPIEGEGLLRWRIPGDDAVRELRLEARRICIRVLPGVRHAVTNTGGGKMLLFAARERTPEGDETVREGV